MVKIYNMKNLIFILSVLFFLGCKKETHLSGTYNRVGKIKNGIFVTDTTKEYFNFISDCQFISTKGSGTYNSSKINLNGNVLNLRIESKMIYIDNVAYFNTNTN